MAQTFQDAPLTPEQAKSVAFIDAPLESAAPPFVPKNAKEFLERMGRAALNVPIGAAKNLGRGVQMIPGVATATDRLYGLPAGASAQAMQPSNPTQTAGGYVGDAALLAATAGAEAGPAIMSKSAGYISNPTVADQLANMARSGAGFTGDTVAAVRAKLATGPVTPEKVATLIVKYGKDAVKGALVAGGGYGAWQAVRHLF